MNPLKLNLSYVVPRIHPLSSPITKALHEFKEKKQQTFEIQSIWQNFTHSSSNFSNNKHYISYKIKIKLPSIGWGPSTTKSELGTSISVSSSRFCCYKQKHAKNQIRLSKTLVNHKTTKKNQQKKIARENYKINGMWKSIRWIKLKQKGIITKLKRE
jgi:hypothetical protein